MIYFAICVKSSLNWALHTHFISPHRRINRFTNPEYGWMNGIYPNLVHSTTGNTTLWMNGMTGIRSV